MFEKEIIRLDAKVLHMIEDAVFCAELANGYQIVAFAEREDRGKVIGVAAGDTVRVQMSPFNMSRGRIVFEK